MAFSSASASPPTTSLPPGAAATAASGPAPASPPATASQEWRAYGLMVLAAMAGVSLGTIPTATLGLFMDPLHREFGWSRTEISLGLTIFAIFGLPLGPIAGMLVDRFGARRIAIPGLALSALVLAGFSLLAGSYVQWLLTWVLYTFAALGTRTLVWNTAISTVFTVSRGLAIAVLLCGIAVATSLAPIVAHGLIEAWGWRGGYIGLGLGWGGLALVLVALFFHERRPSLGPPTGAKAQSAAATRPGGLTVKEALRTPTLYRIALATFLQTTLGAAIMVHLVPLLIAEGLSRTEAAGMAALIGLGSLVGKLATGWMIDRFTTSLIPFACFAGPAIAYLAMLQAAGSAWLLSIAVLILGYTGGASLQLVIYLTTRYAGMRNFGTIFGFISTFMALSAGIGPPLAGAIFDSTGSYRLLLMLGIPAVLFAGLCVFRLGPYPTFEPVPAKETSP